jgi:RHS repeat-associated protein
LGLGLALTSLAAVPAAGQSRLPNGDPKLAEVVRFYHADALGSVRAVSDLDGEVIARHDYLPYGEQIPPETGRDDIAEYGAEAGNKHRFTGKERDSESGLDYFGARYASAAQGRFASVDGGNAGSRIPDAQSWNGYAYALNNPTRYVDPDGDSATVVGAIVGAAVGGGIALWRHESVWQGAVSGAVSGALAGLVVDTGGAALGFYGAAALGGAVGGVSNGMVSRGFRGERTTLADVGIDAGLGAGFGLVGAAAGQGIGALGRRVFGSGAPNVLELGEPGGLRQAAVDAHNLASDHIRKQLSTVALAEVRLANGTVEVWASGSSGRLSDIQQQVLANRGVARFIGGKFHGEQNIGAALPRGATVLRWGISWAAKQKPIPCSSCWPMVDHIGGIIEFE